jgi:hypothetical protein
MSPKDFQELLNEIQDPNAKANLQDFYTRDSDVEDFLKEVQEKEKIEDYH